MHTHSPRRHATSPMPSSSLWCQYFAVAGDDPRPTLLDALARFDKPGLAVDLGAGTGRDSAELLRRGWRVIAIDREQQAVDRLSAIAAPPRLELRLARFEDAQWPAGGPVKAGFPPPVCPAPGFPPRWA